MALEEPEYTDAPAAEDDELLAAAWAKKVRLEVLACRQFGHQWTRGLTTVFRIDAELRARKLGCSRCGMERTDFWFINDYGIWRRSYSRPQDYARDKGVGGSVAIPRSVITDEMTNRSKVSKTLPEEVRKLYDRWKVDR